MTINTSASGGYLAPLSSIAQHDAAFDAFLQAVVAGITGLPPSLVRPRWQPIPPKQPELTVDWSAIGVMREEDLALKARIRHDPTGVIFEPHDPNAPDDGYDVLGKTVSDRVLVTFYGPNAWENASLLADGLCIEQNRSALQLASVGLTSIGDRISAPELINERWVNRVDFTIKLNREIQRIYPVYNLLRAVGTIHANPPGESITIDTDFDSQTAAYEDYYSGA